jgi:HPt (histidine-containing phosphotransfer) domain-containing protein
VEAIWAGAGALAASVLAGVAAILTVVYRARGDASAAAHGQRLECQAAGLRSLQAVADRLESQLNREVRAGAAKQAAIHALYELQTECREDCAELHGQLQVLHALCKHLAQAVRDLGGKAEDVPELPKPRVRTRDPRDDPDFILRSDDQADVLVRQTRQTEPAPGGVVPGPGPGIIP